MGPDLFASFISCPRIRQLVDKARKAYMIVDREEKFIVAAEI
jgi:hypothetical protein